MAKVMVTIEIPEEDQLVIAQKLRFVHDILAKDEDRKELMGVMERFVFGRKHTSIEKKKTEWWKLWKK